MRKFASALVVASALLVGFAAPSLAREHSGGHFAGHAPGAVHRGVGRAPIAAHRGFDGHPGFRAFHGREFHHGPRVFVGVGPTFGWGAYPYAYPYTYDYGYAPTTAWYCPSYGAYYPSVTTCPDPWVPVQ